MLCCVRRAGSGHAGSLLAEGWQISLQTGTWRDGHLAEKTHHHFSVGEVHFWLFDFLAFQQQDAANIGIGDDRLCGMTWGCPCEAAAKVLRTVFLLLPHFYTILMQKPWINPWKPSRDPQNPRVTLSIPKNPPKNSTKLFNNTMKV